MLHFVGIYDFGILTKCSLLHVDSVHFALLVLKYPGPASLMYLRTLIFTSPELPSPPARKRNTYFISIDSSIHRKIYHITDASSSSMFPLVCFSCQPTERSAANLYMYVHARSLLVVFLLLVAILQERVRYQNRRVFLGEGRRCNDLGC